MSQVAENTLHLLTPLAQEKGVALHCELGQGCFVMAQEDDIYGIIFNLVENAIKYNVPDGSVDLVLAAAGNQVVMTVEDTGIGIPEDDIPHIFTRFYRVDKARSRDAGGSGLGLSIVHDAVTLYGGTVAVSSRDTGGTCFEVRFPLCDGKEAQDD